MASWPVESGPVESRPVASWLVESGPVESGLVVTIVEHQERGYGHAPGISPYSSGVRALPGHRIRRTVLRRPVPWRDGFDLIDGILAGAGRPAAALCSIELRCAAPHSFNGFGTFNDDYRAALDERGILLGGDNPVARTNVAPASEPPADTALAAFGYTVPDAGLEAGFGAALDAEPGGASDGPTARRRDRRPSFVVSGAGDLHDQADLRPEAVVGGSTPWKESGPDRARAVLAEIEARLASLGVGWDDTDAVAVYSVEAVDDVLRTVVAHRIGSAVNRGVLRFLARPPIDGLLFEMDARGGVDEVIVDP